MLRQHPGIDKHFIGLLCLDPWLEDLQQGKGELDRFLVTAGRAVCELSHGGNERQRPGERIGANQRRQMSWVRGVNGRRVTRGRFRVVRCGAFRLDGGLGGNAERRLL